MGVCTITQPSEGPAQPPHPTGWIGRHPNQSLARGQADHPTQRGVSENRLLTLSNALGVPITAFTSMLSHPVVHVMPRLVKLNNPVYVAFTQFGMGHYDAVVMNTSDSTHKSYSTPKQSPLNTGSTSCSCGKNVTLQSHCIPLKNRYTTTIKCSPKPRRPGVRFTTSALVCTSCTRGGQENAAIGLVVLQSAEILGLIICFAIHFLCVTIE